MLTPKLIHIGSFEFTTPLILAPMAGVTDSLFRQLCRRLGADLTVSEMVKAHSPLSASSFLYSRGDVKGENGAVSVQILGNNPRIMAETAKMMADNGANIIDINMGCPAKKFAKKPAGSALLGHPQHVSKILCAVVNAVDIPVTLKMRTGVDHKQVNALEIGLIAQSEGVQALAVHGRTRDQRFTGFAEYRTTASMVDVLDIPVFANGDIDTVDTAIRILEQTGAAGLLIGRAARKNPWLFSQIRYRLETGRVAPPVSMEEVKATLLGHLNLIVATYGQVKGSQVITKHIGWLVSGFSGAAKFRQQLSASNSVLKQRELLVAFLDGVSCRGTAKGQGMGAR